jgi:hypothetical protein
MNIPSGKWRMDHEEYGDEHKAAGIRVSSACPRNRQRLIIPRGDIKILLVVKDSMVARNESAGLVAMG